MKTAEETPMAEPDRRARDRNRALIQFMGRDQTSFVSQKVWDAAFEAGEKFGAEKIIARCMCEGRKGVRHPTAGMVTCPECRPIVHFLPKNSTKMCGRSRAPICGHAVILKVQLTDSVCDVTCPDCLVELIDDYKCTDCGDENINVCNSCR